MSLDKNPVKCSGCGETRFVNYRAKKQLCRKCACKKTKQDTAERSKQISISQTLILDILNSGSIGINTNGSPYISNMAEWKFHKKISMRSLRADESLAVFNLLKLDHKKINTNQRRVNTQRLKTACVSYILGLKKQDRFRILNHIFTHIKFINKATAGQVYYVVDKTDFLDKLLNSLNFKFQKGIRGRIVLMDASFYIKGEWFHVKYDENYSHSSKRS